MRTRKQQRRPAQGSEHKWTKGFNKENAGEAVLVGNTVTGNYFEEAKLSREQTRAKNKETLTNLVNNKNVTNAQKTRQCSRLCR